MSVIPPCETGADRPQAGTSSTTTSVVVASEESQAAKYCLDCEYCSTRRQVCLVTLQRLDRLDLTCYPLHTMPG